MKNVNKVAVEAVLALLCSGLAFSQAVFSVVKVPGTSPNSLIAISNGGQVVVNTGTSDSYQVSTWNRISGAQSVGLIGTTSGGAAINSSGDVVGAGDPDHSGNFQAFVSRPTTGVQWLGSLGGDLSAANGINAAGAVVGLSYTAATTQHAFLWTPVTGLQDLTPDLTSIGGGTAMAINSSNQVVGYYFPNGSHNTLGFTWTQAGGLQNLGPAGTLAYAVNDAGTVVGQSPFANANRHAFSWTPTGGINDLGTLGGGESSALSVNSLGWIVGTSLTNSGNGLPHGFLWTPARGMQDFTAVAGISTSQQAYSVQVNDFGVVALATNKGGLLLVPKITATFISSVNPSRLGQPVTFTATLTSIAGPPPDGETVQFVVSGNVLGSATLTGGVARFTTSAIAVGPHAVVANYSGDANYLPAKYTALTQVVNR
jgi:probable HAF family extracellular repeat protein